MAIRGSVFINNQCGIMLLQLGHLLSNVWQPDVESFQSALLNFIDSVLGKKKKYSLPEFFVCFQLTPDYLKLLKDSGFPWTGWPLCPFPLKNPNTRLPSEHYPLTAHHQHESLQQRMLPSTSDMWVQKMNNPTTPLNAYRDLWLRGEGALPDVHLEHSCRLLAASLWTKT